MRFLIDENVPKLISDWLRLQGHDLVLAGEILAGETDKHWLELAENEQRLIMTADKDFGELIFRTSVREVIHGNTTPTSV